MDLPRLLKTYCYKMYYNLRRVPRSSLSEACLQRLPVGIYFKLDFVLVVCVAVSTFIYCKVNYASTYSMDNSANYNFLIKGPTQASTAILGSNVQTADLDNNGIADLIIGLESGDFGVSNSGSVYVIFDSLLSSFTSKLIDLTDSNNYSLRFDGSVLEDNYHGYLSGAGFIASDILGDDGRLELIITEPFSDHTVANRGALYIINNDLINSYSSKQISMDNSDNYTFRIDGPPNTYALFSNGGVKTAHIDGDDDLDLLVGTFPESAGCPTKNGDLWIFYNSLIRTWTDKNISIGDSANYTFKITGAGAEDLLTGGGISAADLTGDGRAEVLIGAPKTDYNGADSGSLYILENDLINSYSQQNISLSDATKYSHRIDGAVAGHEFTNNSSFVHVYDIDNDSMLDIIAGSPKADYGFVNSGSIWIIYNTLFQTLTSQVITLSSDANYSLRIDGDAAGAALFAGYDSPTMVSDFNYNNLADLYVGSYMGASLSGSVFAIFDSVLASYSSKNVSLSSVTNYSHRYNGRTSQMDMFGGNVVLRDVNNDSRVDLLIGAPLYENNDPGGLYIIYNFPHTISFGTNEILFTDTTPSLVGSVTATGSITNISMVQYSIDNNTFNGGVDGWQSCIAGDGEFNSLDESFTCTPSGDLPDGLHTMYVRSYDANVAYTAPAAYDYFDFTVDTTGPSCEIEINSGDAWTTGEGVSLGLTSIDATTSVTDMMISEDSGFSGASWESYSATRDFTLSAGDGTKTVYVKYQDEVNNESVVCSDEIGLDTTAPVDMSLVSIKGYTQNNTKPTLKLKKGSDGGSSITSYTVRLDWGKDSQYELTGIPANGDGGAKNVWVDDSRVKVTFVHEETSDSGDDEIWVYFKGLDGGGGDNGGDGALSEGKHSWEVIAYDTAGNSTVESTEFYIDKNDGLLDDLRLIKKVGASSRLGGKDSISNDKISPTKDGFNSKSTFSSGVVSINKSGQTIVKDTFGNGWELVKKDGKDDSLKIFIKDDKTYEINRDEMSFRIRGSAIDPYKGSKSDDNQDEYESVASGPGLLKIEFKKYIGDSDGDKSDSEYEGYMVREHTFDDDSIKDENGDEKSATFDMEIPDSIESGKYKVTFKLEDKVGNEYESEPFYIVIPETKTSGSGAVLGTMSGLAKSLVNVSGITGSITKEEKVLAETDEDLTNLDSLRLVKVKVVDKKQAPVKNTKVELIETKPGAPSIATPTPITRTTPRIGYTDANGEVTFKGIQLGNYTIKVSYKGKTFDQPITIEDTATKEFHYTIEVQESSVMPWYYWLLLVILILLIIVVMRHILNPRRPAKLY